jgi:hypothetical protein
MIDHRTAAPRSEEAAARLAVEAVATYEFETVLEPEHYFQGLARWARDFHQALGELLDNAFSARRKLHYGDGLRPITLRVGGPARFNLPGRQRPSPPSGGGHLTARSDLGLPR